MLLKRFLFAFILSFSCLWVFSQASNETGCSVMKNGVFKYLDIEDTSAYIVIKNGSHTEYHNNGKYYFTSKMQWVNPLYEVSRLRSVMLGVSDTIFKGV